MFRTIFLGTTLSELATEEMMMNYTLSELATEEMMMNYTSCVDNNNKSRHSYATACGID